MWLGNDGVHREGSRVVGKRIGIDRNAPMERLKKSAARLIEPIQMVMLKVRA